MPRRWRTASPVRASSRFRTRDILRRSSSRRRSRGQWWNFWGADTPVTKALLGQDEHERMAAIRIGVSGWRYAPWRGVFYPRGLPHRSELAFASRRFSTIELNGSFYSLQRPESYASWYRETPEGFVFGVKGPR